METTKVAEAYEIVVAMKIASGASGKHLYDFFCK
uniref:Uncharacterized protein n=1 Tax=Brassica campestris TaxID=3711 RepID=A0A3P6BZ87_BRACM|nr:unnamed protein product [Brassica rapa]